MKKMTDEKIIAAYRGGDYRYGSPSTLEYQGRLAYLDGRNVMSREWQRRANRLEKLLETQK